MNAPLKFKPIGNPILTHKLPLVMAIAGAEGEVQVTVRFVFIPGNPERFDEPAQPDSVEILSILAPNGVNILWLFDQATLTHIEGEIGDRS